MRRKDSQGQIYDAWGIVQPWDKVPYANAVRRTRTECIIAFERHTGRSWAWCKRKMAARCVKIRFEMVDNE